MVDRLACAARTTRRHCYLQRSGVIVIVIRKFRIVTVAAEVHLCDYSSVYEVDTRVIASSGMNIPLFLVDQFTN